MKVNDSVSFGNAIRIHRKELGYTQAFVSEITGMSVSFISDTERGKPTAELEKVLRLATLLGMDCELRARGKNNELLCLRTAKKCGIAVPECFIIDTGGKEDKDILFAVKRYDRIMTEKNRYINGMPVPFRLHQEDFAQAMGIASSCK